MTNSLPLEEPARDEAVMGFEALQAVRKSEERFRLAAQAGKMFAYEWDAATGVGVLSGECAHVLGLNEGTQVIDQQVLSKVHPDDRETVTTAFNELLPEKPCGQISYRIVHPDRGAIWVETSSRAFFDGAGRMLRITGTVADITARKLAEVELARASDRLHDAMEAGKSVGWDWDVKTGRDSWFGDLQTIFGIPASTHIGRVEDFHRRVHPEDRELVAKAVKDAMQNRTPYAAEFRVLRSDSTVRWVAAQGKFHYSSDGEPERMLGIAVDITERKGAEEALRRKDIELAEAQRLARVGSWQWDPENDIVTWSRELYRIAGRDPNLPAVGYKEHNQLYTDESWQRLRRAVEEALRTGAPYELELEMVWADGTTRWLIARGETQCDAAGRILRLHGTVQDITERRRSREALRESEERLRLAAQAGRMYAYEWDRASDMIVRSAEFTHILGSTSEAKNITCQKMLTTVHPDDRAKVIAATNGCTPENPTCRMKYRVLRPDGSVVWLEKHARAFFDEKGKMLRMIGMVADVTEQQLAEETLSSLSRKLIEAQETERARIARDLHDDIGQRLAVLSVMLERMKQASPNSESEVRCRVDELRTQILEISASVHAISHELHSSKLRHLGVINAMRGFCAELSEQQKVEINFVSENVPATVPQDVSLCLFRVLQEALHNAVKYSSVDRFEVELRGTSAAVHLTVRDSGIGFDAESAMRGGGLGLTSMRERLRLVDGELSIDSQPRLGTTVFARVPLGQSSASTRSAGAAR
jgi:PAS domain S-box-containing protein